MTEQGFQEIDISDRLKRALLQAGAGENIIKNLAELIKNCDDAYDALQCKNIETTGIIEVGYWHFIKKKFRSVNAFFVRDYGIGMTLEEARMAFGKKSYGEDTSYDRRNGAIGKGGKDALYGMIDCNIITIRDGIPVLIEVKTNGKGLLESKIHDDVTGVREAIEIINNKISKYCKPIKLNQDGTFAMFKLSTDRPGTKFQNLKNNLTHYYTIRNILNGVNKTSLRLIDVETGETTRIIHDEPESEIIAKPDPFYLQYKTKDGKIIPYQVDVLIKKSKDELEKNPEFGMNILIENGQGGILDNTMFGWESDPAASNIFGKVIIHNWKSLFREDQTILTQNREGIRWFHSFNKQLEVRMKQILAPIIDVERRKQGPNPEADKQLDKKINSVLTFLNKLIEKDEFEVEKESRAPPELMEFSYGRMKIVPGKTKSVKLFLNPNVIPENSEISTTITEGENAGVTIDPIGIVRTPENYFYPPKVPFVKFEVTAIKEGTDSHLKAYFGDQEREVTISIVPEEELYPKDGFSFVPTSAKFVRGRTKKLRLVIDTNLIKPGTIIELSIEDERISLPYKKFTVSEPNMGRYLTEEFIEITSEKSRIKTKLIAKTSTSKNEEREAVCKINVIEKEESKVYFRDYELDRSGDPRKRARFNDGVVYIHVNHPVLKHYFGDHAERIESEPTREAVALLADSILSIALRQWAKMRIEDGKVQILDLSRKDEEIDLEKDRLEFKYGKQIHQTLIAKYHSEKLEN